MTTTLRALLLVLAITTGATAAGARADAGVMQQGFGTGIQGFGSER